jgi:hypothetical protein
MTLSKSCPFDPQGVVKVHLACPSPKGTLCEERSDEATPKYGREIASTGKERRSRNDTRQGIATLQTPCIKREVLRAAVRKTSRFYKLWDYNWRLGYVYSPAAFFKASALSVFSQVNSISSRPKWP